MDDTAQNDTGVYPPLTPDAQNAVDSLQNFMLVSVMIWVGILAYDIFTALKREGSWLEVRGENNLKSRRMFIMRCILFVFAILIIVTYCLVVVTTFMIPFESGSASCTILIKAFS